MTSLPVEIPFDDAGGTSPRNNSASVIDLAIEGRRILFTSDAGVPAINGALDYLNSVGRNSAPPDLVQIPHHGSRHNMDSATLNRLLGRPGQGISRAAFVSVTEAAPKHPSPRIVNGFMRRGCQVASTETQALCWRSLDAPNRPGYGPATLLDPMNEALESDD